jgi:integrase
MNRNHLTETSVARLKLPAGKDDHTWFDDEIKGFGVRKRGRTSVYILQYQLHGKTSKLTLGNTSEIKCEAARNLAKAARGQISQARLGHGVDPAQKRDNARVEAQKPKPDSLGAVIKHYLAARKETMKPRSYEEIRRPLEQTWEPLHSLPITEVSRANVAPVLSAFAKDSGPAAANHARAALSTFFVWCLGEGRCEENPVVGTNKQVENDPRDRILVEIEEAHDDDQPRPINWSELVTIWQALPESDYGNIVKLLALTGCRRDEIGSLRWSEIDFDKRVISLPRDRTKNGKDHKVPLSPLALDILQSVPRREREHVFGRDESGFSGWSKAKERLDEDLKLKPWTLHDIRRTVRTGLGALGIEPHIGEAVINHLPAKLVRTYDVNSYLKEKRAALNLWASELDVALRKARGENITSLPKRKA